MEFYKKIIKPRDANIILSEKECKCASLQAITSEAIKENNKKRLKELVEEINGHLADLRAIKTDNNNEKNREKCDQLINNFEECLAQIVNSPLQNIIPQINGQLQEVENLSNIAIANNDCEELKKLSERMERNIAIIKEIPELKYAKDADAAHEGDNKLLGVLNKYMSLLNRVLNDINTLKNANEAAPEEKLKLFRQKRLTRQSKFINEQFKLAEQRISDGDEHNNISNKSLENSFSQINPIIIIKSSQSMQFNRAQKKSTNNMNDVVGELSEQDEQQQQTKDLIISKREIPVVQRDNFRKMDFNKSLTEQQIENARNQLEIPKSYLKTSESLKTPPRTPTPIKKIFNSFNCVQNINKSASAIIDKSASEDLPSDCNSFFAEEQKNFKLKNTGNPEKKSLSEIKENHMKKLYEVSPPVLPKKKPIPTIRKYCINSPVIEISAPPEIIVEAKKIKSDEQKHIRNSLDLDEEIATHPYSPNEGATITIKRNSSNNSTERSFSFSTFRASTESFNSKDDGVENPLYGYYFMPQNNDLPNLNFSTNNNDTTSSKPNEKETSPKWSQINQLEPDITKLEYSIRKYKGLKRDKDYLTLDKALMKYHLKINDMITETSIDENAKENLLMRLTEAHQQLRYRVENNEKIMKQIFEDVVQIIGRKYQ